MTMSKKAAAILTLIFAMIGSPAFAQAEAVMAALSFLSSLSSSPDDNSWIAEEFTALNIKLDQVLKNQERILKGINLLSSQISQMQSVLVNELNQAPFRAVNADIVSTNAKLQSLARSLDAIKSIEPDRRQPYLNAISQSYKSLKSTLPDSMERLIGIDASYNKVKYPFLAGVASSYLQMLGGLEITEVYLNQNSDPKIDDYDRPWFLMRYVGLASVISSFNNDDRFSDVMSDLDSDYAQTNIDAPKNIVACSNPPSTAGALFKLIHDRGSIICVARENNGGGDGCQGRSEEVYARYITFSEIMPFDLEKVKSQPDSYLLSESPLGRWDWELDMWQVTVGEPVKIADVVAQGISHVIRSEGEVIDCENYNSIRSISNLRSEEDRVLVIDCIEQNYCDDSNTLSEVTTWWDKARDSLNLKALNAEEVNRSSDVLTHLTKMSTTRAAQITR